MNLNQDSGIPLILLHPHPIISAWYINKVFTSFTLSSFSYIIIMGVYMFVTLFLARSIFFFLIGSKDMTSHPRAADQNYPLWRIKPCGVAKSGAGVFDVFVYALVAAAACNWAARCCRLSKGKEPPPKSSAIRFWVPLVSRFIIATVELHALWHTHTLFTSKNVIKREFRKILILEPCVSISIDIIIC